MLGQLYNNRKLATGEYIMGQAKQRGTLEERRLQAIQREQAETMAHLKERAENTILWPDYMIKCDFGMLDLMAMRIRDLEREEKKWLMFELAFPINREAFGLDK